MLSPPLLGKIIQHKKENGGFVLGLIQILGLRPYYNKKKKKQELGHAFYNEGWTAGSILEILDNPQRILDKIPESEHYNLFMTVANCEGGPRVFKHQTVMVIDIDHIQEGSEFQVFEAVCELLGLSPSLSGLVKSGNGIHIYIQLDEAIESQSYFKQHKLFYSYMCRAINDALQRQGLAGHADDAVFDARRLMRMPGTINDKEKMLKKGLSTRCEVLQKTMEAQGFSLKKASGLPQVSLKDAVNPTSIQRFGAPDHKTILDQCLFLKQAGENPDGLSEPQWYAMLSIVGHFEKGQEWAHKLSSGHPDYDKDETDEKLAQAMAASGPRTCNNINSLWSGCHKCPHRESKSPILIKGENHIATERTGFRNILVTESGHVSKRVNYDDLIKFYTKQHKGVHIAETNEYFLWNGVYYKSSNNVEVKSFAEKYIKNPPPSESERVEFLNKMRVVCLKNQDWFEKSTIKKFNFENGIYDMEKDELTEHSEDYPFLGVMPFKYDPEARAPIFEKFLDEVTEGKKELQKILLEFAGYCLSGDENWLQQFLILLGTGANGKSVFIELLQFMVGKDQSTGYNIDFITTNDNARFAASKALFNACGESDGTLTKKHCSMLKDLTTGGKVPIKKLYANVDTVYFRTKLMFAWNEIPTIHDTTPAFTRRLLIVPFNKTFTEIEQDRDILDKLKNERSGVFNMVLGAYRKLKRSGKKIQQPEEVKALATKVTNQSDILYMFGKEHVHITNHEKDFVTKSALYGIFLDFCDNNRYTPMAKSKFISIVEPKFHIECTKDNIRRSKTLGKYGYRGVKLVLEDNTF